MVASFAFIFFMIIMMLVAFLGGSIISEKWSIGINVVFGLLMILYIMFDFSVIKKSESFIQALDSDMQLKFTLMFGFKLLIDLMGLFWTIARFYLMAKR
jgi:FtsH-binding integral membrane protein